MVVEFLPGTPAKLLDRFNKDANKFKVMIVLAIHGNDEPYMESSAISDIELCQLKCFLDAYVTRRIMRGQSD